MTMMPPVNNAVTVTMGNDLMPMRCKFRNSSLRSKSRRSTRRAISNSKTPSPPIRDSTPLAFAPSASTTGLAREEDSVCIARASVRQAR